MMRMYKMGIGIALCTVSMAMQAMHMVPEFREALMFGGVHQVRHFVEEVQAPINQPDRDGFTPLIIAAANGNKDAVLYLLQHGALVDFQEPEEQWTALMFAAVNNRVDIVDILLQHGARIDVQEGEGWTALMIAASHGCEAVARHLIDAHAQRNVVNSLNQTARDIAIAYGYRAIADLLDQLPDESNF